jgi:hypothetical protein
MIDGVEYSVAKSAEDQKAIYRFRHFILVETDHYFPDDGSECISDRFDGLLETRLIQARVGGTLIGSLRLVLDGPKGVPSYSFFDVPAAMKNLADAGSRALMVGDLNRIVVDRTWRNRQIGFHLMTIGHYLGIRAGVTHFVGISNPRTLTLFLNKLGWLIVGEQMFDYSHKRIWFVSLIRRRGSTWGLSTKDLSTPRDRGQRSDHFSMNYANQLWQRLVRIAFFPRRGS